MLAACQLKIVETGHESFYQSLRKSRDIRSEVVGRLEAFAISDLTLSPKGDSFIR